MADTVTARAAAARGFVRSLNILLKFARMYDFGHPRTAKQYDTAWTELKTALGSEDEAGLLLAVSGDNLLIDGTPLESAAAEKSFARMLSSAGIASIHFSPKVTQSSLARFVRGFPTSSSAKAAQLAEQLKAALAGDPHIHVNEVCFVPADSAVAKTTMAAQLAAKTLGMNSEQTDELLNDPEKLLQLLVAADGAKSGLGPGKGPGEGPGAGPGSGPGFGPGSGPGLGPGKGPGLGQGLGAGLGPGRGLGKEPGLGPGSGPGLASGGGASGAETASSPRANSSVSGSGSWNIVGGNRGGQPIDPNAGGFWLSKDNQGGAGSAASGDIFSVAGGLGSANVENQGAVGDSGHRTVGAQPSSSQANSGVAVEGSVTPVKGGSGVNSGTWNIVPESKRGSPLDPNAGGFWLKKETSDGIVASEPVTGAASGLASAPLTSSEVAQSGEGTGRGPGSGPGFGPGLGPGLGTGSGSGLGPGNGPGAGGTSGRGRADGGFGSVRGSGEPSGTWNIVGGSGSGNPIDPSAGGFWLTKDGAGAPAGLAGAAPPIAPSTSGSPNSNPQTAGGSAPLSGTTGYSGAAPAGLASGPAGPDVATGADSSGRFPGRVESGGAPTTRWTNASAGIRTSRAARGGAGSMAVETGLMTLQNDELQGIMQVLAQIARTNDESKQIDPASFQSRLSTLPRRARFTVSQALSALAAQAPTGASDKPTLLKLAEHIAIRFALESYERGEIEVNAVKQMLDEMNTELDGLRKILGVYEEKMARAGIHVQSQAELLAQEFWTQVSEEKKKKVIESPDAWCVPPVRLREYIEKLIAAGEKESVEKVLANYTNGIQHKEAEARRQTALGLAELAKIYVTTSEKISSDAMQIVSDQLVQEKDSQLQSLLGAAFVRLSQEAAKARSFSGLQKSVELLEKLESERPGTGKALRPRIAMENRLPEFIDEALKKGSVPSGLSDLMRQMPQPSAEQIAGRFSRVGFREDCELLMAMMNSLGPEGLEHLRKQLKQGGQGEAIDTVGILARIDLETLEKVLPDRMREWKRTAHDRVVRQLASSGAPERGRLLLDIFDYLDSLIKPLAIDEIGMSGEKAADMRLLRIAEGDLPRGSTDYLRLKAIEALGRLRTSGAEAVLRRVAEARKTFRWANPSELRVVAAQALEKIDPEWMRNFVPRSGLNIAEFSIELLDSDPNSSAIRQRRYPRLRLERPVPAQTMNLKDNCRLDISEVGLGGGVAVCEQRLHPGNVVEFRMSGGQKSIKAQTIVRDANTQARAFEVVDMDLEDRAKLRKLLVQLGNIQKQSTPNERNRHGGRTILIASS